MKFRSSLAGRVAALLLALSITVPMAVSAQDATPTVAGITQPPTKAQNNEALKAAFAESDEPVGNADGTYIIGTTSDLQSTNPFLAESSPSLDVVGAIYEGFF